MSAIDPTAIAPAPSPDAQYRVKANAAAEQFEGFFISQMLKEMRAATLAFAADDSVFKDPVASDMQGMADRQVAEHMAGQHAFGVADAILRQLLPPAAVRPEPAAGSEAGHGGFDKLSPNGGGALELGTARSNPARSDPARSDSVRPEPVEGLVGGQGGFHKLGSNGGSALNLGSASPVTRLNDTTLNPPSSSVAFSR